MGDRSAPRSPMAWQNSLGEMKKHSTRLAQTASCRCPDKWLALDVEQMIAKRGAEWVAWDQRPRCRSCGIPGHYMASPGDSTPFRPLMTGYGHHIERKAFLLGFGFSKRDIVRIKALAEATTENMIPVALNDLDVPYRVGACWPGTERHSSGDVLGEWAGRALLYWKLKDAELERWRRRRPGPRVVGR